MIFSQLQKRKFFRRFKVFFTKVLLPVTGCALLLFLGFYLLKEKGITISEVIKKPRTPAVQHSAATRQSTPAQQNATKQQSTTTEQLTAAQKVSRALATADYDDALKLLKENNQDTDGYLKQIRAQVMKELSIDMKFHYLPGRKRHVTALASEYPVLSLDDPYYLTINASDKCFVYILKINHEQKVETLYPNKVVPTVNPIPPGKLRIPDGSDWFRLNDSPGVEQIYLVATRWQNNEIEELLAKISAEQDPGLAKQYTNKLLSRLQREEGSTDKIPGLVYGAYQFNHL